MSRGEERAAQLRERAERKRDEAQAMREADEQLLGVMNGTPILRGHHSEKRHRRDMDRLHRRMDKQVELHRDADHLERQARAAERNTAIYADEPEALDSLRAKLGELEEKREALKAYNKRKRAEGEPQAPAYMLQNLGANIRRVKARIAELEAKESAPAREPVEGDGWLLEEDRDDDRVRICFDAKPGEELRARLRGEGWRWSRANGAWQRQATDNAWRSALRILGAV